MDRDTLESYAYDKSIPERRRIEALDALRLLAQNEGDDAAAVRYASDLIPLLFGYLDSSKDEDPELWEMLFQAYATKAPYDLHSYLIALEWDRPRSQQFYAPRAKFLRPIVDDITAMMVRNEYDGIMESMPPRVGKSTLGIFTLTWCIGRNPDDPILATAYSEKIVRMFHEGVQEIYSDSQYRFKDIFPQVKLIDSSAKDLTLDFRDDGKSTPRKYKTLTCRAVDGSLTGATEARQLLYADDLVRDIEEAVNKSRLDFLYEKLLANVMSRKKEGCKELFIGTRWSLHDPLARLERLHDNNPRFKIYRVPALDPDTDESNFDYEGGFSTEYYRNLRQVYYENNDQATWESVYQQNPIEREGLLFPSDQLTYVLSLPDLVQSPPDDIFAFCDVAFGGEDFLCMPIAYQWGEEPPTIVDVVFVKGGYDTTEPLVAGALLKHGVKRAVFEANNGGDFYARDIQRLLKENGGKTSITATRAPSNKSKEARIFQYAPDVLSFRYMHGSVASPMYLAYMRNLTSYVMYGKNKNDDAADATAGLAAMLKKNTAAKVEVFERRFI